MYCVARWRYLHLKRITWPDVSVYFCVILSLESFCSGWMGGEYDVVHKDVLECGDSERYVALFG